MNRTFLWIRLAVYTVWIPFLAVTPWGLRHPDPFFASTFVACVVILLWFSFERQRRAGIACWFDRSRSGRFIDAILWNSAVTLLLVETVLGIAGAIWHHPLLLAPDARSRVRIASFRASPFAKNHDDICNSRGFNDTEWANPKPPNTTRILALGDSFAFGIVGYRANFLTILEAELNESGVGPVEVLNFGIAGIRPVDYLHLLNEEGLALDPDLVLVCVYLGNDFAKMRRGSRLRLPNWRVHAFLCRLRRVWFRRPAAVTHATPPGPVTQLTSVDTNPTFSPADYDLIVSRHLRVLASHPPPDTESAISDTLAVLDDIVRVAHPRPVVLAILPNELLVSPTLRREICARHGVDETALDLYRLRRVLTDHFASTEVRLVDLLPPLAAAEADGATYHPRDSHWNIRGNRAAATALVDALTPWVQSLTRRP